MVASTGATARQVQLNGDRRQKCETEHAAHSLYFRPIHSIMGMYFCQAIYIDYISAWRSVEITLRCPVRNNENSELNGVKSDSLH